VLELNHVAAIVGGFESQQKHIGQNGVRFVPVPKARQKTAVKFLNANAFATPTWALKPEILRRIEPVGALDRVRNAQMRVLNSLMSSTRFARLVEQEAVDGASAYRPSEFLEDVRQGIWSELDAPAIRIDAYRRNLQRSHIDLMGERLNGRTATSDDQRAHLRGELRSLSQHIARALQRTTDRTTRLHLEDARDQIARALDPKFAPQQPAATGALPFGRPGADDSFDHSEQFCWPDYIIHRSRDN
jgi:hypothetical protein